MTEKSVYHVLSRIDCSGFTEKKNGLTYLSWSHAWNHVKSLFPDATWELHEFEHVEQGLIVKKPFLKDETGILVKTSVTIQGLSLSETLFVMDGANKAQKVLPYTYQVKEWKDKKWTGKMIDKEVEAASMFDINTAIKRCLTKNLALHGLGINIYAGEDLPLAQETEEEKAEKEKAKKEAEAKLLETHIKTIYDKLNSCQSDAECVSLWPTVGTHLASDKDFITAFQKKRTELSKAVKQ